MNELQLSLKIYALAIAQSQLGVKESPLGSNRGPEIDMYIRAAGLDPTKGSYAWCASFVVWCFQQAALQNNVKSPCPRTAGVLNMLNLSKSQGAKIYTPQDIKLHPLTLAIPGDIFIMKFTPSTGHTGFIESYNPTTHEITTIEGNTNLAGSREGIAVMRRTRPISTIKAFIQF